MEVQDQSVKDVIIEGGQLLMLSNVAEQLAKLKNL